MGSRTNGLVAVARFLRCHDFTPALETIPFDPDKENKPRVDPPEARLEGFLERQPHQSHAHSFYSDRMITCEVRVNVGDVHNVSHGARTIAYRDRSGKKFVQHLLPY